jgi:predicted O-methyltransferase YrrM
LPAVIAEPASPRLLNVAVGLRRSARIRPLLRVVFRGLQRLGINITPRHFYWPIPYLAELEQRDWPMLPPIAGVDLRLASQLQFLETVVARYAREFQYPDAPLTPAYEYHCSNGWFESVDAEVLYAMVRHYKPKRVIEIGGGYSTRITARAIRENICRDRADCDLITIEPAPDKVLAQGVPGVSRLIARPVQAVELDLFTTLDSGDILFIDSSHVVSVGNDVVYEYLEILPRLKKGVIVHAHDIFLPSDYPRASVLEGFCFWSEQYLLQAFLSFNAHFEVLWGGSAMQMFHPEALEEAFPRWRDSYLRMPQAVKQFIPTIDERRVWPSSFWMRRRIASCDQGCGDADAHP